MTFTRWSASPPHQPFSPGLARAYGWGFVGIVSLQNHWWQTPDLPHALQAAGSNLAGNAKIVSYGLSMGGAGAILASQFIDLHRCVAVGPPLIIDQEYSPWEERFQSAWAGRDLLFRPDFHRHQPGTTIIAYDPFFELDNAHVRQMAANGLTITRLPSPFMGHTPFYEVAQSGLYPEITKSLVIDGDIEAGRALIRKARNARGLFQYHTNAWLTKRGKLNGDEVQISRASQLIETFGDHDFLLEHRAQLLLQAGQFVEAGQEYARLADASGRKKYIKMTRRCEILAKMAGGAQA